MKGKAPAFAAGALLCACAGRLQPSADHEGGLEEDREGQRHVDGSEVTKECHNCEPLLLLNGRVS
jgi:hypothetical protein